MKLTLSNFFSIITVFFLGSIVTQAQEICIVTADFTNGTNYIVYWEQPDDITGLDSVIVYRKQSTDNIFSRIGAVNIGAGEQTFFEDAAANTIDVTKYAIAYKTDGGVIGALSPWHQPIVNDYEGNGLWEWTAYEKEDQVDESYITGYTCWLDMGGGAGYVSIGSVPNTQTFWTDSNFPSHTDGVYVIEAGLPSCDYETKAEINTSRSNIKQQFPNSEMSISEKEDAVFTLTPNPSTDIVLVEFKNAHQSKVWINTVNGAKVYETINTSQTLKIDVSNFEAGVYFINVSSGKKITSRKFVKN